MVMMTAMMIMITMTPTVVDDAVDQAKDDDHNNDDQNDDKENADDCNGGNNTLSIKERPRCEVEVELVTNDISLAL